MVIQTKVQCLPICHSNFSLSFFSLNSLWCFKTFWNQALLCNAFGCTGHLKGVCPRSGSWRPRCLPVVRLSRLPPDPPLIRPRCDAAGWPPRDKSRHERHNPPTRTAEFGWSSHNLWHLRLELPGVLAQPDISHLPFDTQEDVHAKVASSHNLLSVARSTTLVAPWTDRVAAENRLLGFAWKQHEVAASVARTQPRWQRQPPGESHQNARAMHPGTDNFHSACFLKVEW